MFHKRSIRRVHKRPIQTVIFQQLFTLHIPKHLAQLSPSHIHPQEHRNLPPRPLLHPPLHNLIIVQTHHLSTSRPPTTRQQQISIHRASTLSLRATRPTPTTVLCNSKDTFSNANVTSGRSTFITVLYIFIVFETKKRDTCLSCCTTPVSEFSRPLSHRTGVQVPLI